jgi:hypothetical protein
MKNREPRFRVMLPARLRWDGDWVAGSVRNVSSHGLMLCSPQVPPPGSYVELCVGGETITARAVWADDQLCGLRTRTPIDFERLRAPAASADRRSDLVAFGSAVRDSAHQPDRRRAPEHSRHLSYAFQYLTASIVATIAAGSIGWEVYQTLAAPLSAVTQSMAGAPPSQDIAARNP